MTGRIDVPHRVCDYNCMVSGLEDLYAQRVRASLPPYFLFGLGAFCSPAYLKVSRSGAPRMFYPNAGQPARLYDFLKDVMQLEMRQSEGRSFPFALRTAKEAVDAGTPVLIGACDMYHLGYLDKFYHKIHVPIHYFLMTGYDDGAGHIILLDCGRLEPQQLSYEDLEKAWDAATPGFSKKNTLRVFTFPEQPPDPEQVFLCSLRKKAGANLQRVPDFIGVSAFGKLAKEISAWQSELTAGEYRASLLHLVQYCGFPPSLPDGESGMVSTHRAARQEFADLLNWGAREFAAPALADAAGLLSQSGELIARLIGEIWDSMDVRPLPSSVPVMLQRIMQLEMQANQIIMHTAAV